MEMERSRAAEQQSSRAAEQQEQTDRQSRAEQFVLNEDVRTNVAAQLDSGPFAIRASITAQVESVPFASVRTDVASRQESIFSFYVYPGWRSRPAPYRTLANHPPTSPWLLGSLGTSLR